MSHLRLLGLSVKSKKSFSFTRGIFCMQKVRLSEADLSNIYLKWKLDIYQINVNKNITNEWKF